MKATCDMGTCGSIPVDKGVACAPGSSEKCDGNGQCVDCLDDVDCVSASCVNGVYTAASTCQGGVCVIGATKNCGNTQKHCSPTLGCVDCILPTDCVSPTGNCMQATCDNGMCGTGPAPKGTPCTTLPGVTCDDGGQCIQAKYVFVSSVVFPPVFNGAMAADDKCNMLASAANLGGKWVAWLSDANSPVANRLPQTGVPPQSQVPYLRLDDMQVAASLALLASATANHDNPITVDEMGHPQSGFVWTGTLPSGMWSGASCGAWNGAGTLATVGDSTAVNANWTTLTPDKTCAMNARLYCFLK